MDSKKIVIPGGTGFIGDYVARYLVSKGYDVVVLSRTKSGVVDDILYVPWDAQSVGEWARHLEGAYAVVNFSGRSINCRFTSLNKKEILESRIQSVQVLLRACHEARVPPSVFIQASSVGFYGHTQDICTENSPLGAGFLADVCARWETAFHATDLAATRKVVLRIGVVLASNGGALKRMLPLARNYLGGMLGNGQQRVSWVHIDDLTRMIEFSLNTSKVVGNYNAVGIHPVTNRVFMATLRSTLRRPWSPPIPGFMVRLGAFTLMRSDAGVVLQGAGCVPKRFLSQGFVFRYTRLSQALSQLLGV